MEGFTQVGPGMTLVDTSVLQTLITQVRELQSTVMTTVAELKETKKKWLTAQEVMSETGFSKNWLTSNKQLIGFSTIGGCLRFKRSDVDDFIEANYFKVKQRKASRA